MKIEYVEKAAFDSIDAPCIRDCGKCGDEDKHNYIWAYIKDGFIAGAEWRINSVWRNTSEIPTKQIPILAMRSDGSCEKVFFITKLRWKSFVKRCNIVCWAYIEDLKPVK